MTTALVWCELDPRALTANMQAFRRLVGPDTLLTVPVKANAYGHGLIPAARAFIDGGADWLCVHALEEAEALRAAGITAPIYILGPVALTRLADAVALDARLVVYNSETIVHLAACGLSARLHLKVETGNHRLGVELAEARALAAQIAATPGLELEGVSSHYANADEAADHRYAHGQLARFDTIVEALRADGHAIPIRHMANSAATILWPEHAYEMVRVGVAAYGLWPSPETRAATQEAGRIDFQLRPALTWKTRIAQVRDLPAGAAIGYGCTAVTRRPTRLAVLPVGYADGYDRGLSNLAHVLIGGRRAPVMGRVCMNLIMVDVTDGPAPALEDEVVLLGRQVSPGQPALPEQPDPEITAEQLAAWAGTINYEVVARISTHLPRLTRRG
jgi:alanine racemase